MTHCLILLRVRPSMLPSKIDLSFSVPFEPLSKPALYSPVSCVDRPRRAKGLSVPLMLAILTSRLVQERISSSAFTPRWTRSGSLHFQQICAAGELIALQSWDPKTDIAELGSSKRLYGKSVALIVMWRKSLGVMWRRWVGCAGLA
jgi:hypothetical protein